MKALVTGATGFAGRWLVRELDAAGHAVVGMPPSRQLDIADAAAVRRLVRGAEPDVIAHLASPSSGAQASADPARAVRTMVGGTVAVTRAAGSLRRRPGLLVVSSAEIYARVAPDAPPIAEHAPVEPATLYGLLKLAQEEIATAAAARDGLPLVVVRPFNHVGPGQRPASAIGSFARRIDEVRRGAAEALAVGNLDVERDISDVRDVVIAYRLLLERLADGRIGRPPAIVNVASGRTVRLRDVVEQLCRLASVEPSIHTDPGLVRPDDPSRVVGDATRLRELTGWRPRIPLRQTLADVLDATGA